MVRQRLDRHLPGNSRSAVSEGTRHISIRDRLAKSATALRPDNAGWPTVNVLSEEKHWVTHILRCHKFYDYASLWPMNADRPHAFALEFAAKIGSRARRLSDHLVVFAQDRGQIALLEMMRVLST